MASTSLRGRRGFLSDRLPLLVGSNPDRVAPAHIMNGFAMEALGPGGMAGRTIALVRRYEIDPSVSYLSAPLVNKEDRRRRLGDSLRVVLDPDRRIFRKQGSFFPLHAGLVDENRGMDDGFGRDVWRLVNAYRDDAHDLVRTLLTPSVAEDALTGLGMALCSGGSSGDGDRATDAWPWSKDRKGGFANRFGAALADLVMNPVVTDTKRVRSIRVATLSRAVGTVAFLGALRSPELSDGKANSWSDLAPMFVFGGVPPGRLHSLPIRLACRSYEVVVEAQRRCLQKVLSDRLGGARIPKDTPRSQQFASLLATTFPGLPARQREIAVEDVKWDTDRAKLGANLLKRLYPPGYLARSYRTIGRMIGFAGPERGAGAPRFMMETPELALLVSATVGDRSSIPFREWLDVAYDQFGIILGIGEKVDYRELLKPLGIGGPLRRALDENHDLLRRRLVRCGLASEFSDGETEVHGPFEPGSDS